METRATYHRLGTRAFWVFVLKESAPAILILIIWFILLVLKGAGVRETLAGLEKFNPQLINLAEQVVNHGMVIGPGLFMAGIAFAFLMGVLAYFSYQYMLDETAFRIKRGIINKDEISIPYNQIEDINVGQTLMFHILGVSRMSIMTAGRDDKYGDQTNDPSEGNLPAIEKHRAEEIRAELLRRSEIQKIVTVAPTI